MEENSFLSHNLLYALAEGASELIAAVDNDLCFTFFNETYKKEFNENFGKNILLGDCLEELLIEFPEQYLKSKTAWTKVLLGNRFTETVELYSNGVQKFYESNYIPIYKEDQSIDGAIQVSKNITTLKQIEKEAEFNKNFYTLANSLPQIVWTATPDGLLDYFNDQWFRYSGMDYSLSFGEGWANAIHPDDLPLLIEIWTDCLSKGIDYYVQARVKAANGNYRWLLIRALPYRDADQNIIHWFGTCTDIEEQKESELKLQQISQELIKANEQIQLRNKRLTKINADLDNFVYTASHDLKSPINNIESLVTSLYENLKSSEESKEEGLLLLNLIEKSVERFKNTINDLTDVAKVQNEEVEDEEEVVLDSLLKEVIQTLHGLIRKYDAVIISDFNQAATIRFSIKNLRSIFYNLLSNAIKYSSPSRTPEINISTAINDGFIILQVQDNGLGIREQDKEKVFKIFKRLHLHVEGSGVGMAIVKKIIDNNGGKIEVESEVGKGTLFRLFFPLQKNVLDLLS